MRFVVLGCAFMVACGDPASHTDASTDASTIDTFRFDAGEVDAAFDSATDAAADAITADVDTRDGGDTTDAGDAGFSACPGAQILCGTQCIDPLTDDTYCGAAIDCLGGNSGEDCAPGFVCDGAGECAVSCQEGLLACDGRCIDPLADRRYCGAEGDCEGENDGDECASGFICNGSGECTPSCRSGYLACGDACINPLTDRQFCGAEGDCEGENAGDICPSGFKCNGAGECALECAEMLVACGGRCIDPLRSRAYCGADGDCAGENAGEECADGSFCVDGGCAFHCPEGYRDVDGDCLPLCTPTWSPGCVCPEAMHLCSAECVSDFSLSTCGSSCTACPTDPDGETSCDGTMCVVECIDGLIFADDRCVRFAQHAYIKASNPDENDHFGFGMTISADGHTLVVASAESSSAAGINGDQTDNSLMNSGAVYVFVRSGTTWTQQAYIKASNPGSADSFGQNLSISGDGNTLAVGAIRESSSASGIGGDQLNDDLTASGAVYVFTRTAGTWSQQAYIKASNPDEQDWFGSDIALSTNGNLLAVGAHHEQSVATGINGDQTNNGTSWAGAVYVFTRSGVTWSQEAYVKASNTGYEDMFGASIELSGDGNTMAVGAVREDSIFTGVGAAQGNDGASNSGAVYVFVRADGVWSQQVYIKASNAQAADAFGAELALSTDGNTLAVGASGEDSNATGIGGTQANDAAAASGAVYVFTRSAGTWSQQAYIKASNSEAGDTFGLALSVSADGNTLAVGAVSEDSDATGVDGEQLNNDASTSGAVYVFERIASTWSQTTYIKASNAEAFDNFGAQRSLTLSADGLTLAAGAYGERSNAVGINGDQSNNLRVGSGAVYVFHRAD